MTSPTLHDEGWTAYLCNIAPPGRLLQFWNEYNGERWTGYADEIWPEFNIAYLWWRWTAIGRREEKA
jgi:hypothetical protein